MNRIRELGGRPFLLIPWLVLTLTGGGVHEHGPPSGDLLRHLLRATTPAPASLSIAGESRTSSENYCAACMWQLTAHVVLGTAPALPAPAAPSASLPASSIGGPAPAPPRPAARAPPSH
jgi:hypothetical protein